MANAHEAAPKSGLSDLAIWSIGAVALLLSLIAKDSLFYLVLQTPIDARAASSFSRPSLLSVCVAALVSFAVAYKSRRAGLAKALSYIALTALVAIVVSVSYGAYIYGRNFSFFFYDPAGHGNIPMHWVYLHTRTKTLAIVLPIIAGALAGWMVRQLRGRRDR